jgi:hypothetical protein
MDFTFDAASFEMVQNLAFPLIKALTGFDTSEFVGDQSELFIKVGDAFGDISALFVVIGTALEDGKLTAEEINTIILGAKSIPEAIDAIVAFFDDEDAPEPTA